MLNFDTRIKNTFNSPKISSACHFKGLVDKTSVSDTFEHSNKSYNIKINNKKTVPLTQPNVWALYDNQRFVSFLESDKEIQEPISLDLSIMKEYSIELSLPILLKLKNPRKDNFLQVVKNKYGVDLSEQPKLYRFVGKDELINLLVDKEVLPQRYQNKFDVTTNPELNWNRFRITFKPNEDFSIVSSKNIEQNIGMNKEDYYYLKTSEYKLSDILAIDELTPEGLKPIDISSFNS